MAVVKSHIFSQIVNSVAGITYFYSRFGSIIARARTIPTDPNTPFQQFVRAQFSAAVIGWQTLTQPQRDSWDFYAKNTPWVNALGDTCFLTGQNMYIGIRTCVRRWNAFEPALTFATPRCLAGMLPSPSATCTVKPPGTPGIGFRLLIQNQSDVETVNFALWISSAQNPSINYFKGPYVSPNYSTPGPALPHNTAGVDFTGLVLGQRYFYKIRAIGSPVANWISNPTHGYCTAVSYP